MRRGKPLRADPNKVREFLNRGRQEIARKTPLARSTLSKVGEPRGDRRRAPAPDSAGLTAKQWRDAVWEADMGYCCGCGAQVPRDADRWTWQAHHPIPKQALKREGLRHLVNDVRFGVVTCRRCHERHTTRTETIPLDKMPLRVLDAAHEIGPRWADLLGREHPAAGCSGEREDRAER